MGERETACFALFAFDGAHVMLCMEKRASLDLPSADLAAAAADAVSILAVCRGRTASLGKLPQVGGGGGGGGRGGRDGRSGRTDGLRQAGTTDGEERARV